MFATSQEYFDLAIEPTEFSGSYSSELVALRKKFVELVKKVAISNPDINIRFFYASRGDDSDVGESVRARSKQIIDTVKSYFSRVKVEFEFVGSARLIELFRKNRQFSIDLPFLDYLAGAGEGYIAVVKIGDYYQFVCDEDGGLRRYLFDSNVRDYLGQNKINEDIGASLDNESVPDFWWLNNGITILVTKAVINGKHIVLQDVQVVNGLQTTETIYRHFRSGKTTSWNRMLAVKIIVSSNEKLRDSIIRATNNQSAIEQSALHATEKIQRDIEDVLEKK
jgi:hypothetical protein